MSFLIQCSGAICVPHSFNFQVNLLPALLLGGLLLLGLPLLLSLFPGNVFPYLYVVIRGRLRKVSRLWFPVDTMATSKLNVS